LDRRYFLEAKAARWSKTSPQHIDAAALSRILPPTFLDASFAVIRHPVERMRSVFLRHRDIEKTIPPDTDFDAWCRKLPLRGFALDNHTRPMTDFIPAGCKLFRLEDGLAPLIAWLDGLAGDDSGPREIAMVNSHTQKLAALKRQGGKIPLVCGETVSLLVQKYEKDMMLGSYKSGLEDKSDPPLKVVPMTREAVKPTRTVVLHYHLFKNAGTSLDSMLKKHFAERWVTQEFKHQKGNNTASVEEWIRTAPDAVAFSSHTAVGPLPQVEGVTIVPVMLLRDPVKRIISAYKFERQQQVDNWGANLAKAEDITGYVRTRLDTKGDRQCRNFQTSRLAPFFPGDAPEIDRALQGLEMLHACGLIGLVSHFDQFVDTLIARVRQIDPGFQAEAVTANVSKKGTAPEDAALLEMLAEVNGDDEIILSKARALLSVT